MYIGVVMRKRVSEIFLSTKIRIPPLRRNLVNRPNLIQRLNDGLAQNNRLTLISAPAGYGKSTLLSEWAAQVNIPVAWLSLEKGENTPTRFWSYFFTALSTIPHLRQAGIGESILQALQSTQPPAMEMLLATLVNDLSILDEEAVLVLDDLHIITESQIHQDLIFLIEHLPLSTGSLHLVVASRMDPPWPMARWRARNELTELRASDLRFSYEEIFQFLYQTLQFKLSSQDVTALQARTEGWIAGLQMAAVTMQGRLKAQGSQGVSRFIESFTGSNRFILDYLMEEVVSQQPIEVRDFLQDTSILEQLTAPLCDALMGKQDSQMILDQMEQANLFLIPLDEERHWYRYHHLFAELLRKRLKQSQPEHITELNLRASQWYAENNFLSEAISHALDAGDIWRVNEYISGNALVMVDHVELLDVLSHFEQIPEVQICSKPWLCVAYAWVKAYVDPSGDMDRILLRAMESVGGVEGALERQYLTSHLDAVWAYEAWVKGRADLALNFIHTASENLAEDDWITRAHLLNIEGLALQYLDYLPEATQSFEAAIAAGKKCGRLQETFFAYTNLGFVNYLQGKLNRAFSLSQDVLSLAQAHFAYDRPGQVLSRMPILAYAYANMSLVQIEWNEVDEALANARRGVTLAEQWKQADALHFLLTCLSKALGAAGELDEAFTINQQAMRLAMNVSPWFKRLSIYNEVWLNLIKGDISAAANLFTEVESLISEELKHGGTYLVLKVSVYHAQRNYPGVLAALEGLMEGFEQAGKYWTLINAQPFQALALQALGREEEALKVIAHCLDLTDPEGYVRIFVERGAPMAKLLQAALSRGIKPGTINKLLLAFNIPVEAGQSGGSSFPPTRSKSLIAELIEPLSERELQVLRLLDSALTSEEIAGELFVSVHTVRTHIRNIYGKLDVHGRIEAVHKARDLGLI